MQGPEGRQIVRAKQSRLGRYDEARPAGELGTMGAAGMNGGGEMGVSHASLLEIVWRRRWTVTLAVMACVIGAFVYVMKATPIYSCGARLYVEQTGPMSLNDMGGTERHSVSYLYTQAELLKSTPILSKALEIVDARRMLTFAG